MVDSFAALEKRIASKKMLPMYCPSCGTRYLKESIPEMRVYICMFCRTVAKKEVKLEMEK